MNCKEKLSENNENKPLAPLCLTNPVEVEVTGLQDFLYEQENQKPPSLDSDEKKPGFWKSFFSDKKCKNCFQKKNECTCKSKKKKKHRGVERGPVAQNTKCDENSTAFLNCSAYGTSKEVNKNGNCPTKCALPMNQGCGCHLYFCIDSKRKKQPIKSKNNKNQHNEKIKMERESLVQTCHDEVPNVTIICDESRDNLDSPKNYIQTEHWISRTQIDDISKSKGGQRNAAKPFNFSSGEKTIFQFKSYDKNLLSVNSKSKSTLKGVESNTENMCLHSISPSKLQKKDYSLNENENKFNEKESKLKERNKNPTLLSNFTDELNKTETIVSNVKIDLQKSHENVSMDKKPKATTHFGRESEEDSLLEREYGNFTRNRKKTRKSTTKSGLFVRNSLITLRRERRQSEMEGRVSLILDKLGTIENKITELEKMNAREKENNITMGITCEGKQSKVAVKFDNRSSKEIYENPQNYIGISPLEEKLNKTIRITSNNESIYVKTPGEVKVVRSKQKEDPSNRSKQLIYENAYKMDAHTVGSNLTTIQCKNPKVVVSYNKTEPFCNNPNCVEKWRRISEELKKSNFNFVKCESCGRKK